MQSEASGFGNIITWLRACQELLVVVIGLGMYALIVQSSNIEANSIQTVIVVGLAIIYAAIILWKPMSLPAKKPQPLTWKAFGQAVKIVTVVVLASTLVMIFISSPDDEGGSTLGTFLIYVVLMITLGSAGLAAERSLSLDLFPIFRRHEVSRIIYVLAAAFFLAMLAMFWGNLINEPLTRLGQFLGDIPTNPAEAAESFYFDNSFNLLINLLIGAGIFEELLFRVGILTLAWALTRRFGIGLLVSSLLFGLYHISPLSGISMYNLPAPVSEVLISGLMGAFTGLVYRYRGFSAAVLMHSLGDWISILLLAGAMG
jgi:membrane protease YdiL (CAAX protease family)